MSDDLSGYSVEQLQNIVYGAPDEAEYFDKSSNAYYKIEGEWSYLSRRPYEFWDVSVKAPYHVQNNTSGDFIKLSDIRAELDSRLSPCDWCNGFGMVGNMLESEACPHCNGDKVCLSNSAKNDTQISDEKTRLINRIEKHALTAKGCPDQARVVLLSSINRIIKEEQSVIERVKQLRSRVDNLDDTAHAEFERTANDFHQGASAAFSQVLNLIDELLKEVAGDE